MDTYQLLDRNQQKYYLYEDGKPLLALWGVGFDEKPFNADQIASLIAALKSRGWSIMLGVNDDCVRIVHLNGRVPNILIL